MLLEVSKTLIYKTFILLSLIFKTKPKTNQCLFTMHQLTYKKRFQKNVRYILITPYQKSAMERFCKKF